MEEIRLTYVEVLAIDHRHDDIGLTPMTVRPTGARVNDTYLYLANPAEYGSFVRAFAEPLLHGVAVATEELIPSALIGSSLW